MFTRKLPDSLKKKGMEDIASRVETRGGQIQKYLDDLAADPNLKGKDVSDKVRRILPGFANALDGYVSGDLPPPRAGTAVGTIVPTLE